MKEESEKYETLIYTRIAEKEEKEKGKGKKSTCRNNG